MHTRIAEIQSYLQHHDFSLAVRRILDASLDTADGTLLKEAIQVSQTYRQYKEGELPAAFFESANSLLSKINAVTERFAFQPARLVTASEIGKTYDSGYFSLEPISIQVNTGDILGVVGENGNGKTTLLRCMAGQLALSSGELDFPLLEHPDHYAIKHHVAFIPQRIPKWYGLLKDNLHFAAAIAGVTGEENTTMVDFMLERLDLTPYAHLTWNQISSGYRTRFEIARILLQKPRLLVLDEPLANLDINAQQSILTDLRFMAKSVHNPMGILLSSQQLHEVEKIADTVLLIKDGTCLFRTGEQEKTATAFVIELETTANRETLLQVLDGKGELQFNGGFYTITSSKLPAQEVLSTLVTGSIPITYFRDITHSTKRFL
ncbi:MULTISPECIES: ABC transporter ATP-binding protein [Niastella]|uniref:ABC transporter ATP-binding protein n=1 Tax=Niastella soli TaxID=2821487 RepID=A0ABS3Z3M0_9BACT|nr:ABC transporter ATP-binding protein [Niastella soli]MBO9204764.1 ABC transporter ATP-binding protein [Niastella soli]